MNNFYREISVHVTRSLANYFPDNFDREVKPFGIYRNALVWVERLVRGMGKLLGRELSVTVLSRSNFYLENLVRFESTYDLLADKDSRAKYVELLAYRILGFTKVELTLAKQDLAGMRARVKKMRTGETLKVDRKYGFDRLEQYDLHDAGYDLRLFLGGNGVLNDFLMQQYNYRDQICVNPGDIVIDAGGCWGDTALYFAACGAERVFVFEFIPSNVAIYAKNLEINPGVAGRLDLIELAVWETSGERLSFDDCGQASRVAKEGVYAGKTETLSIDDLVKRKSLERLDFIKMDIEGAELSALKGAAGAIRRFKPRLAIAIYHEPHDMIEIPALLQSLNPNYEFHLDYFTTVGDEIILYAIDRHGT
jgi:FkbM family methyltransferase